MHVKQFGKGTRHTVCRFSSSFSTLVFWQSGRQIRGRGGGVTGSFACMTGIKNQQLFKGFLLPSVCAFEVSSSEDTLRHFVVSLHTSEVSRVLLLLRLQRETNYCQTTAMQRNPRLKLSPALRFCSWPVLLYFDGWCVFIPRLILSTAVRDGAHLCPFFSQQFKMYSKWTIVKKKHIYG